MLPVVEGCANCLAADLGLPPAEEVLASLHDGDPSVMTASLRETLQGGGAFHHGDLTREERIAVERGFRQPDGRLRVLVAASTVAAGVNTPASTMIVVKTAFRAAGGDIAYSVAHYKNMAGRAGRLGFDAQGKAIVMAETVMEKNSLPRRYVQGTPEPLRSSFDERNPGTSLLRLLRRADRRHRAPVHHQPRFTGRPRRYPQHRRWCTFRCKQRVSDHRCRQGGRL